MADRLVYILALAAVRLVRLLPLEACFGLGRAVGAFLWLILPGYRRLARENLRIAFGDEMSPEEIRALAFKHFTTLGANALSAIKIPSMPHDAIGRAATIENLGLLQKTIAAGRPVVLAINHIGNWELYAQLVFKMPGVKFGTVYQALHNKFIDDLVNGDRRRLGVQTFDRKQGFQSAIALLREPGILGVLVDQHAGDGGVWTPFFGRLCSTSPLAATLALRTDAAVVPVAIHTSGFAKWRVVVGKEIRWRADKPDQLTLDINKALEQQVRESPADWFWVHNRWKIPKPAFLINGAKRGIHLPPRDPPPAAFRIVVRSPNWLGDAIMSVPAARAFKFGRPDASVTILAPEKLAGFWRSVPDIDGVVEIEPGESVFSVAQKIHDRFDAAVLFPNSLRAALEVRIARIRRRVGYGGHWRRWLLDHAIRPPAGAQGRPVHQALVYWRIAERCGAQAMPPAKPLWKPNRRERVIGICPGAEYGPAKRWPAYKFAKLVDEVGARTDCQWVVLGTKADKNLAAEIGRGHPNVTDLTGKTTLGELMELLSRLTGLVTNDTGTMHLADYIGTPLVAIFGSTEPELTGPLGPRSTVIRQKAECSPCFLRECPIDFRCMLDIPMERVVEATLKLLK
jgi:lipopolysaccharide heptosyltransferase II